MRLLLLSLWLIAGDCLVDCSSYLATSPAICLAPCGEEEVKAQNIDLALKTKFSIQVSPLMAFGPVEITVRTKILNPTREWYCPSYEWSWGDDTKSEYTSDCLPWEELDKESQDRDVRETKKHLYKAPGTYTITVKLTQGKNTHKLAQNIVVLEGR